MGPRTAYECLKARETALPNIFSLDPAFHELMPPKVHLYPPRLQTAKTLPFTFLKHAVTKPSPHPHNTPCSLWEQALAEA